MRFTLIPSRRYVSRTNHFCCLSPRDYTLAYETIATIAPGLLPSPYDPLRPSHGVNQSSFVVNRSSFVGDPGTFSRPSVNSCCYYTPLTQSSFGILLPVMCYFMPIVECSLSECGVTYVLPPTSKLCYSFPSQSYSSDLLCKLPIPSASK